MATTQDPDLDVLVVGAGPVGLAVAGELARRGASCAIIDRALEPAGQSRALAVHARTLEALDTAGLAEEALAAGHRIHGFHAYTEGERLFHLDLTDIDSPYSFMLVLPQSETERILAAHLAGYGVPVERGVALLSLAQDPSGVTATLRDQGGSVRGVRARYVIGCDGSHSMVRESLGLSFDGVKYEERFALADLRVEADLSPDAVHTFFGHDGVVVMIPMNGPGRFRIVADVTSLVPEDGEIEADLPLFQRLLDERGARGARVSSPTWISVFRIHRRIVPRYRVGRVFLAGDAAHVHSPAGGQGMNTGIQDAFNLAWKIALVLKGGAREALLESYDAERRPVGATTLSGTERVTRAATLRNPLAQVARNHIAAFITGWHPLRRKMTRDIAETGIAYGPGPQFAEDRPPWIGAPLLTNRESERASVRDSMDFGAAPHAGSRAPEVRLGSGAAGDRLLSRLRGGRHVLYLFDGLAATDAGYRNLAVIVASVRTRAANRIEPVVVIPGAGRPAALAADVPVLLDPTRAAHARYGATAECLYLVRPDGVVGYRAQPADARKLWAYWERVFG